MSRVLAASTIVVALTIAASSGAFLAAADGPAPAPASERVQFAGCVKPGVENSCLIIESGGKTYNVTSAKGLKVGDFAAGTGVAGATMSICQQGIPLSEIVLENPPPPHAPCPK